MAYLSASPSASELRHIWDSQLTGSRNPQILVTLITLIADILWAARRATRAHETASFGEHGGDREDEEEEEDGSMGQGGNGSTQPELSEGQRQLLSQAADGLAVYVVGGSCLLTDLNIHLFETVLACIFQHHAPVMP